MKFPIAPSGFYGEAPAQSDRLLPPGYAVIARNAKLYTRELAPFRDSRRVANLTKTGTKKTIFLWNPTVGEDETGTITAVSNSTPIKITSPGHGRTNGDRLYLDATGIGNVDGKIHVITVVDTDNFTLNSTTAGGVSTSGGYWIEQTGFWFHWIDVVDVIRGPIPTDTVARTYFTGDGVPKITYAPIATSGGGTNYPTNTYNLGIPKPATPITFTLGAGGTCDEADKLASAYVYTYVSELGEEGPPSDPSALAQFCPGQEVNLANMATGPGGAYNIVTKRIYRYPSGQVVLNFVAEIPVANVSYQDTLLDEELGELLPSGDPIWNPPPSNLTNLGLLSNGIGYGSVGKTIYVTPPFQLHAWPLDWTLTCDFPVVAMASYGTAIVACTEGYPYVIAGTDPSALTQTKYDDYPYGCVAKRGVCVIEGIGVVYPSRIGLVAIGAGEPQIVTDNILTPDQWMAFNPESLIAFTHHGMYFGFYTNSTESAGFIIDPRQNSRGLIRLTHSCTGGYSDPSTGKLYLIINGYVEEWEGSTNLLDYLWESGLIMLPHPVNPAYARVRGKTQNETTLKVYADDTLVSTRTVTNRDPFTLDPGYLTEELRVRLEGSDTIRTGALAESIEDLREQ